MRENSSNVTLFCTYLLTEIPHALMTCFCCLTLHLEKWLLSLAVCVLRLISALLVTDIPTFKQKEHLNQTTRQNSVLTKHFMRSFNQKYMYAHAVWMCEKPTFKMSFVYKCICHNQNLINCIHWDPTHLCVYQFLSSHQTYLHMTCKQAQTCVLLIRMH